VNGFSRRTVLAIYDRAAISGQFGNPTAPICEVMEICQGAEAVQLHHRRARGMGSTRRPDTNQAANGLAVCYADHAWIEAHPELAKAYGWRVEQAATPALVPVRRRGQLVLLADDGSVTPLPPTGAWGETPGLGEGLDDDVWPQGEYPEVVL
jgi:hypothetical protein